VLPDSVDKEKKDTGIILRAGTDVTEVKEGETIIVVGHTVMNPLGISPDKFGIMYLA